MSEKTNKGSKVGAEVLGRTLGRAGGTVHTTVETAGRGVGSLVGGLFDDLYDAYKGIKEQFAPADPEDLKKRLQEKRDREKVRQAHKAEVAKMRDQYALEETKHRLAELEKRVK